MGLLLAKTNRIRLWSDFDAEWMQGEKKREGEWASERANKSILAKRSDSISRFSATWKSINVTHSCRAFAFIVADLSRISTVLMIKLNFTFVLVRFAGFSVLSLNVWWLQPRSPDALHRINRDFVFHWVDPLYRFDWRCTCTHKTNTWILRQPIYLYLPLSYSFSSFLWCVCVCIQSELLMPFFVVVAHFGIDENR